MEKTPLEDRIKDVIRGQGALSLAAFMAMALQDPDHGYYRVRDPVGRVGDFITAPEVSQLFGEMIGIWCAETWRQMGAPTEFALVELGPGRGTMMRDIWRSTAHVAGFHAAARLNMVESNIVLRRRQAEILADAAPVFLDSVADLPPLPTMLVANEFFDALPVRQFERGFDGWYERMVAVADDRLVFILRPLATGELNFVPTELRDKPPGTVFEVSPDAIATMRSLARHLVREGGAGLIVDYGYTAWPDRQTAQAISAHRMVGFLDRPGEVDLTAHVDFASLAEVARREGCMAMPVIGQGTFLEEHGIALRAAMLARRADMAQAEAIQQGLRRLTATDAMGTLFKVLALTAPPRD